MRWRRHHLFICALLLLLTASSCSPRYTPTNVFDGVVIENDGQTLFVEGNAAGSSSANVAYRVFVPLSNRSVLRNHRIEFETVDGYRITAEDIFVGDHVSITFETLLEMDPGILDNPSRIVVQRSAR